jgi:hypothetical protein
MPPLEMEWMLMDAFLRAIVLQLDSCGSWYSILH